MSKSVSSSSSSSSSSTVVGTASPAAVTGALSALAAGVQAGNVATVTRLIWVLCLLLIVLLIYGYVYFRMLQSRECSAMTAAYGELNGRVYSMTTDIQSAYVLRDMYIKSAYNCCSGGDYSNDFVDLCTLKNLLKQGVRGLDMEIYATGGGARPVVATSAAAGSFYVKETLNYVPFADVLDAVANYAFSGSSAPNPLDPVILHLRVRSGRKELYDALAALLRGHEGLLLGREFSYGASSKNFGDTALGALMGRVAVLVDASNPAFEQSPDFCEFVNGTSNSPFMRALPYHAIKFTPDMNELVEFNKTGMTLGMPDAGSSPACPNAAVMREMGVQMLAMRYSLIGDSALEESDRFFDEAGAAFVLKPQQLRHIPIVIEKPPEQDPDLSFADRVVKSDYYEFTI